MAVDDAQEPMAPVHFFSHGSTMMLGEESASAAYWKKCGDAALAAGIEHVVMMGAHWATTSPGILISANPTPTKSPVAFVHPSIYKPYTLVPDLAYIPTIQSLLTAAHIPSKTDPNFEWIHDCFLILIRMFPGGCPPTTILSANARYDPHLHAAIGAALRPLRRRSARTLFVGSGGAVHNLYRNRWAPMILYRDNFAMEHPPAPWALEFRQEVLDAFVPRGSAVASGLSAEEDAKRGSGRAVRTPGYDDNNNNNNKKHGKATGGAGGPLLRRRVTSLMKHPLFRDAHATDDHFMAALFVAGLCGGLGDEGLPAEMGAEDWELTNMCNAQYTLGRWE